MPNSVIVQGYEQIQAANRSCSQDMLPSGALGKAVLYGTQQLQKGTTAARTSIPARTRPVRPPTCMG
jgi:hypothetical protein